MALLTKVHKTSSNNMCIDIELNNICNYKCSYCHPNSNDGGNSLAYNNLKIFLNKIIKDDKCIVLISGGEPTLHPNIKELLEYLKSVNVYVVLMSNGFKSLDWWTQYIKYIDKLILSYHSECTTPKSFLNKVYDLSQYIHVTVNVPMIHNDFYKSLQLANKVQLIENTSVVLKPLKDRATNDLFEYTEEQLEIINSAYVNEDTPTITHIYSDGSTEVIPSAQVLSKKLNMYKGWKCWKGIDVIKIQATGRYFLASCDLKYSKNYGNINEKELSLPSDYVICKYDKCFCLTDILNIRKER